MNERSALFPEPELPSGASLLAQGRADAAMWTVGASPFLSEHGVSSEYDYKLAQMSAGRVMQHAQIGYRDLDKSCRAYRDIHAECLKHGVRVDRYGLCLDWSMALPRAVRAQGMRGTGMLLNSPEDFVRLASSAPVAAHFGDFVLGFPAALENTQAALAAGSTAIGNLGQYFTFRVPGWDDDVEATAATVRAMGLIAAQPVKVLIHSNIDDGYAAQFNDLTSCLGMIMIERDIVKRLVGGTIAHCYGHHFSEPATRLAFQRAMFRLEAFPGTIVYGNTTSYRGTPAANYASLSSYLLVDAVAQLAHATGHAINPVPVTENERIPEIDEVTDAQLFAGRLVEHAADYQTMINEDVVGAITDRLLTGAVQFQTNVMRGLAAMGVDCDDVFEVLLALRRLGARKLEASYGAGETDRGQPGGRRPIVAATTVSEIRHMAEARLCRVSGDARARLASAKLRVLVATSDVHEHGKLLIEAVLQGLTVEALDGGVSTDAALLANQAFREVPDAIAISTYNGVALTYFKELQAALRQRGLDIPILIGGRLNQIPEASNSSLPVDVGDELAAAGAVVCRDADALVPALLAVAVERRRTPVYAS
jgi:methylmalonyl-CoA mutase cobalamin-binding subunit